MKVPNPKPVEDEYEYEEDYGDEWGSEDAGDEWGSDYGDEYGDYEEEAYEAPRAQKPRKASSKGKKSKAGKKSGKAEKKKKSKGNSIPLAWNFNRINLALVAIGCVLYFVGVQEARLASRANSQPQQITLANLLKSRPGGHIYLDLSGFVLRDNLVYEAKSNAGPYTKIWVPADPIGQQGETLLPGVPIPMTSGPIKLIIKSTDHSSDVEIAALAMEGVNGSVRGMLVNEIESMGGEEKKLLQTSHRGTNFDTCYIFEVGREPSGAIKVIAFFLGSIVFFLLGGAWILFVHADE